MTDAPTFPRRDTAGRVRSLRELVFASGLATVIGLAALAVVEGALSAVGLSRFGDASGWLAAVLPALLFFDDLRAWRPHAVRYLVAVVALVVAVGIGLLAAGLPRGLPPLFAGAVGALVAAVMYAPIWFVGVRRLTGNR